MITAEKLTALTTCGPTMLAEVLNSSGYKDCKFKTARFLGMTNGGQFCYTVSFEEDGAETVGKVFISYNHANDSITADF
jgi:hypothetical protein